MDAEGARRAFGGEVRRLRERAGLTQEGLALRCGLDRAYLVGIEHAARNPSLVVIARLAGALGVAPARLLRTVGGSAGGDGRGARRRRR